MYFINIFGIFALDLMHILDFRELNYSIKWLPGALYVYLFIINSIDYIF